MKKVFFISVLFVSLFQISCSSDDDNSGEVNVSEEDNEIAENNAPSQATLIISEESGLSIDLTWDEVTDVDGDVVTYDLYANDVIVAADLTEVDYTWSAEGLDDVIYPVVFTVVSKDANGGEATSNEVELDDPIIGVWYLTSLADILDDEGTLSDFMDADEVGTCNDKEDSFVFTKDNNFIDSFQDLEDGVCFTVTSEFIWENIGSQNYSFVFTDEDGVESLVEIFFVFEGNTINYLSSDSSFIYTKQ